ncbi:hypothetical protein AB0M02_31280 [Actinoplanes sp. NPDC051861]|uniref:hypothetical protein n=1 Tax=Actinoplanes sp. NPDC051861 TaxID=3155170 RepID=UPI003428F538
MRASLDEVYRTGVARTDGDVRCGLPGLFDLTYEPRRAADGTVIGIWVTGVETARLCRLGGSAGCTEPAEVKVADSWGDSAWGCPAHVEDAILNVRTVFIASEELGGLAAYLNR